MCPSAPPLDRYLLAWSTIHCGILGASLASMAVSLAVCGDGNAIARHGRQSPPASGGRGFRSFRNWRKRYANQRRVDVPAQRRPAVAGIVDLALAQKASALQRLDHLQRLVRVQRLAERVAAHVLAGD